MDIALNAHVECSDGPIGKVENIIVNPAHERVTHLVVRENNIDNTLRLIPEKNDTGIHAGQDHAVGQQGKIPQSARLPAVRNSFPPTLCSF